MRLHDYHEHDRHGRRHFGWKSFDHAGGGCDPFFRHRHGDRHAGRGGHGGFGERGNGKHRFFQRGAFKFALLELLASGPMHGYQLIKAMEEKSGGLYAPSPGSVYPNLQLLEDMNLIVCEASDGKKLYRITEDGLAALQERNQALGEQQRERAERMERYGMQHRPRGGRHAQHELRSFMKEWSDVVYLMAAAAGAVQADPSSGQAKRFQELMGRLQEDLKVMLDVSDSQDN